LEGGLRTGPRSSTLVVIVGLVVLGLCLYLARRFPATQSIISVDLQASSGKTLQVFVNELTRPPMSQALEPGVRRRYVFNIADDVVFLRVDPTDAAGAIVEIFDVEVADATGTRVRFGPAELRGWNRANVASIGGDAAAYRFETATDDAMLWTTPSLILRRRLPAWLRPVVGVLRSSTFPLEVFAIGWVAWALVGVGRRDRWAYLPITGTALASVLWLVPLVAGLSDRPPPVDVAVGRAAVMGESLRGRQMAVLAAVFTTALVASVAGLVERKRRRRENEGGPSIPSVPPPLAGRSRMRRLAAASLIVVVAASFLPDLGGFLEAARAQRYVPHWDGENVVYWAYLISRGAIPYRDFWYPYAGFSVFDQPAPFGILFKAAYETTLFGLFVLAFYRASGRRVGATLAAAAVLLAGYRSGLFSALDRYLLAVDVLISFLGIAVTGPAGWGGYALFWLACSLAVFFEPAQLLYAAPGVAIATVLDVLDQPVGSRRRIAAHLVRCLAVPAVAGAAYLAWLWHRGQLAGFLAFNLTLGDTAAYAALPTDVATFARSPQSAAFLVLVAAPLLIGVGLFDRLRSGAVGGALSCRILIGLGCIATMMLQKFLVRPNEEQLTYLVPLGVLSAVLLVRSRRSAADQVVLGFFLGAGVAAFVLNGGTTVLAHRLLDAPHRLASGWATLRDTAALQEVNGTAFAESRFVWFTEERALAQKLQTLSGGRSPEVFALSDVPALYVLLGRVVYHANLYNASPIYEQRRIVDWLSSAEVPWVVFDPAQLSFDGFAKAVRSPLVFAQVVRDYVPEGREGRFEIARRRRPQEPIALDYWRDKLGPSVNLGHLPRWSSVARLRPCVEPGAPCQEVAAIALDSRAPAAVSVPFEIQGRRYRVFFEAVPGVTRYYVSLERIWFWNAARAAGAPARVATERMPPSVVAAVVLKAARPDVLY
jgi:hypothetical protein